LDNANSNTDFLDKENQKAEENNKILKEFDDYWDL